MWTCALSPQAALDARDKRSSLDCDADADKLTVRHVELTSLRLPFLRVTNCSRMTPVFVASLPEVLGKA
jgi:hypothetical protein